MTIAVESSKIDPAEDPAIDRRTRASLKELNRGSSPFWELPGDEPRNIVTARQNQTPVDLSGIEVDKRQIMVDGREITLRGIPSTDAALRQAAAELARHLVSPLG